MNDYTVKANLAAGFYNLTPFQKLSRRPFRMGTTLALTKLLGKLHTSMEVGAETFWGDRMRVVLPEPVSSLIQRYGIYEEKVTMFLIRNLGPGDVFIDIGSHLGYFTLLSAALVGPTGQVHCFEPGQETHRLLTQNTQGKPNVFRNKTAAFSHSTELEFRDFGVAYSSFNSIFAPRMDSTGKSPAAYRVKAESIDEYCRRKNLCPRVIKIDAEGAEIPILDGMKDTLSKARPLLSMEVGDLSEETAGDSLKLIRRIESHGYSTHEFAAGKFVSHAHRNSYGYDNLFFLPLG